jgi:hypothetical protein
MQKFDILCGYRLLSRKLSSGALMAIAIAAKKSKSARCMLDQDNKNLPLLEALLDSQCTQLEQFSMEFPQRCLMNHDLASCMLDYIESLAALQTFSVCRKNRIVQNGDSILEWI